MKKLIQSSEMKRFKSIRIIDYNCLNKDQALVSISYKDSNERLFAFAQYQKTNNDYFKLNLSGRMIHFRFTDGNHCSMEDICSYEEGIAVKCLHNYFLGFFGNSMEYHWTTDEFGRIPRIQNLSLCLHWNLGDRRYVENDNYSSFPIKWLYLRCDRIKPISRNSKLYEAESIEVHQHIHTVPEFLRYFKGKQAFLTCDWCCFYDLIEFVKLWKSGKGFRKLEYLRIRIIGEDNLPQNFILNSMKAKHIDATKQAPVHSVPKAYARPDSGPNTDPIASHDYVVRGYDDRVASVFMQGKTFSFGVWNKKEDDFLRIMD
ncbi:hypothetical protein B9Z55_015333 [Caenorhabditis nigoni]|uniref:F-box associated domain-containing protein n=1 Tax=Caenorhabditis nigoni TaxID=1611254 RepID=A0A2G5U9S4_9PELO|nr:hypothetical protein B9Z55_015333 [Caenorhabditis nigoni]